ncbi:helix-turn-helix domain-containing protein [Streptomyces sp. NBC_01304]|uniref:helix-turn-helix domain-containing protein n=1 Tax=Streptomyces sp. NBC_01304 TaxID=2903818 RepID=UPI002E14AE34|nr:helix-turn-helix domain-containing protein [Streptomyces sp. NBC_01304]
MTNQQSDPGPLATDEHGRPIVKLLAAGWNDERVSRELSLSKRTVQRRIQRFMAEHGCSSRFALGYVLGMQAGRGLVPEGSDQQASARGLPLTGR